MVAAGSWLPLGAGSRSIASDGPAVTVDSSAGFVVEAGSKWGVDGTGRPYYDPAGVVDAEAATFHAAARPYLST